MKLFRFLSILWACAVAVAQSTQVQINVATKAALAAVTVQTWQTNLTAVTVDDGTTWQFQPGAVTATNVVTVLESVGVAGRWQRLYSGPTIASWAGLGNWALDAQACLDIGAKHVLLDSASGYASTNVIIPASAQLELSPGLNLQVGSYYIQLAGDDATLLGNGSIITSTNSTVADYAALRVQKVGGGLQYRNRVEDIKVVGNNGYNIVGAGVQATGLQNARFKNISSVQWKKSGAIGMLISSDNTAGLNNVTLNNISLGDNYYGLKIRTDPDAGGPYITGYLFINSLMLGGNVYSLYSDGNAYAQSHALCPGYLEINGLFDQLAGNCLRSVYVQGGVYWKLYHGFYDGVGDAGYNFLEIDGNAGSTFEIPSMEDALITSTGAGGVQIKSYREPGTTVYGGSSTAAAYFRPDQGSKNMGLHIGPGWDTNSVGYGILRLAGRKDTTTTFQWNISPNGTGVQSLGFLYGTSDTFSYANGAKAQLMVGGGIELARSSSVPTPTLGTNSVAFYGQISTNTGATSGSVPWAKNSQGNWRVPLFTVTTTMPTYPEEGMMVRSNRAFYIWDGGIPNWVLFGGTE